MPGRPHRIRRQRWIIRASSSADAFALRQRFRHEWETVLLPAFEAAFDDFAPGDEVVRIPKIELRFKMDPGEPLPRDLVASIRAQLGERLHELKTDPQARREAALSRTPVARDRFEALLQYLRTGTVRWDAAEPGADLLAAGLLEICRENKAALCEVLGGDHATKDFCFRLFQLLPEPEAVALVRALGGAIAEAWREPLIRVFVALLERGAARWGRQSLLECVAAMLTMALAHRDHAEPPSMEALLEQGNGTVSWPALLELVPEVRRFESSRASRAGWIDGTGRTGTLLVQSRREIPMDVTPPAGEPQAMRASSVPQRRAGLQEDFPLLVGSAGLVLLHPFLPRFFATLGLKGPSEVVLSSLPRAAALLHLLATGREAVFEFELPFAKVLLGLEPGTPLCVTEGILGDADRDEAEALLKAVISHWPALKKTSPAGLRHSFLNRQGLLRKADNGWRLHIERTGFDVLLDQLPWGLAVVKLPWMKHPLHTEW